LLDNIKPFLYIFRYFHIDPNNILLLIAAAKNAAYNIKNTANEKSYKS